MAPPSRSPFSRGEIPRACIAACIVVVVIVVVVVDDNDRAVNLPIYLFPSVSNDRVGADRNCFFQLYPIDDRCPFLSSKRDKVTPQSPSRNDAFDARRAGNVKKEEEKEEEEEGRWEFSRCRIVWNLRDALDATFPYRRGANRCARYRQSRAAPLL